MKIVARLGACVADLVSSVHGLVTEKETNKYLDQRLLTINCILNAIRMAVEQIVAERKEDEINLLKKVVNE